MFIGSKEFNTDGNCFIAGILNVTPDSFYDGGCYSSVGPALDRTAVMIAEGADIIDVGGESTRPGHDEVSQQQELDRVIPVIEALCSRFDITLSVDTSAAVVAKAALNAGAAMINDVRGFRHDPALAGVVASAGAVCCLSHNSGKDKITDSMSELLRELEDTAGQAIAAGISRDKVILDPGIGFSKTHEMNLEAINRIDEINRLGYPVMLGVSRKSVVGTALGGLPPGERLEGSLAAAVISVVRGCSFIRVHDVRETRRAVTMAQAILFARTETFSGDSGFRT